ncbi:MAG: glycosyltransferase family 2 protein [Rhodothermales bacterium]|nr:glycosyltransferase family 2 protein [Rhodothermales bacterium]MBO6778901.1 glycosyltransferase family 2 protein [Rhodothermales bacterium]
MAVVIPALNEEASIGLVLADIPQGLVDVVVVVDNGSTDRTAEVAAEAGALLVREDRRGYGFACLAGIAAAREAGATVLVFLDGDYSDYPEQLDQVVGPILDGQVDFVVGSRMRGRRSRGALLPQARFGNWLAGFLLKAGWGAEFTDLGPFRAVRLAALDRLRMQDETYGWTVEMQIKAVEAGLRYTEVPVDYRARIGESKITGTVRGTVLASYRILQLLAGYWMTRGSREYPAEA